MENEIYNRSSIIKKSGGTSIFINGMPSRHGPEASLVEEFLQTDLPVPKHGENRTIFIEPSLGHLRPDIVIVYWNPLTSVSWPETRLLLETLDLRLVHLLFIGGPLSQGQLEIFFPRRLDDLLNRLKKAKLITKINDEWHLKNLTEIFSIRRILTFEAKISALSKALDQALLNTWFASESYVLTKSIKPTEKIINQAKSRGVGLWLLPKGNTPKALIYPKQNPLPQSYISWFFNELTWKTSIGVYQ